ncbi:MAG TPA: protein kinase [Bryobacteraceae bacterium]|jgi:serine/threonine-protein kinase|nr:protein kinase [Bryobacteraceae bacterium]
MTTERWQRVKELFETARQAPPGDRERLLLDSGDLDLAREVRVLLEAHDQSSDFLEEPAMASRAQVVADQIPAPFVGTRVGAYLIMRQVGEGGMGVVYEGVRADGQFEQTVAIKILKRWMLSEVDISRFRAERQILADLDHPNIARLLDGGTTPDGLPYYAMEFVEGQFVDVFCRDRGLSVPERLELFRQVCDAVEYAHRRGVIHRDLKPANILVTAAGTLKLLDFGIAKVQENGADTPRTATLHRVATPLYASPEQLRGDPITPASDIYSLGVLLYELLTGVHPFRNSNDPVHMVANAICEQEPEPPSKRAGQRAWARDLDHVVLKAMRKSPAERYPTAADLSGEIGRYLERRPVLARSGSLARTARRTFRRVWRPASVAVMALALVAGLWSRFGVVPAKSPRRSLAVVGFQNLSGRGDASWIATALAEMLATDLASSERVRVVSAETVDRVKSDLNVTDSEQYVREVRGRLRTNLNVDYFVTGSYLAPSGGADSSLRLYVRLQDARSGQIIAGASETGTAGELSSLVSEAVGDLLRNSEWSDVARKRTAGVLGPFANPASAKLYAEGLERLRRFDTLGARDRFRKAVEADPKNPLAHSAYGSSLRTLGYEEQSRAEAKLAYDLSSTLPREERLSVAGRYYATTNNWSQAISTYRTLWDLFNDNPDYGLRLADVQINAGKPNDAISTVQALRGMPAGKNVAPNTDLIEAEAARMQSDYTRELAAAARALGASTSTNARLLEAEAYQHKGNALYGLDRYDDALAAFRSAEAIHRELGNTFGIASILLREGLPFWKKGDYASNRDFTEKALALFEQIGNRSAMAPALNVLALATRGQGDLVGALKMLEQAIAIARELGAKDNLSAALNNAGNILRRLNRQDEARRYYEECLSIAVQLNNRQQIARSHITLSSIDFDEGNLLSASDHIQQALAMVTSLNDARLKAVVLQHMGDMKEAQGDLAGARQAYEESISLSRTLKAQQYIADGAATVADIAREQREYAAAHRWWSEAMDYYRGQKQKNGLWDAQLIDARIRIATGGAAGTDKEIEDSVAGFHSIQAAARETSAYSVLAESYLAQRKAGQARSAIQRGHEAYLATHEFQARMKYRLVSALVTAAAGDRTRAAQELRTLLAELESKNWSQLASEARQALAEIR